MKIVKTVLLLVLVLNCAGLFAQFGQDDLEVTVSAAALSKAVPGKTVDLKLTFSVPEGYHAYHKGNPGDPTPPEVSFSELSGLSLVKETWDEPHIATDSDTGDESWEYEGEFSILYTFNVPEDAVGPIHLKGSHSTQFCNAGGCMMSQAEFSVDIEVDLSSIGPKLPEGEAPVIVAEAEFKTEAKAGGKAELTVIFGVTEHFHFYHKNNAERGYSVPIGFLWPELNGLKLLEIVWPKPYEHVEDAENDWVELELSHGAKFTFIFEVPADADGKDLSLKGGFNAQVCNVDGCHDRAGEFVATLKVRGKAETDVVNPIPETPQADLSPLTAENGLVWERDLLKANKAASDKQLPMLVLYATDENSTNRKFVSVVHSSKFAKAVKGRFVLYAIDSLAEGQHPEAISMAAALGNAPVLAVLNFDGREVAKFTAPANVLLLTKDDVIEFVQSAIEKLNKLNKDPRDAVDSHGFYLNFDYAMEQAKKQGKQLLVDFNGKNCPPCRKMEKYVFTVPEVHELMQKFVVVSIQNDISNKTYNALWAKYRPSKRAPVPYYVVMDHEAKVLRGIGSTLPSDSKLPKNAEAHKFIDFLKGKSGVIGPEEPKPEEDEEVKLPKDWPKGLHAPIYPAIEDGFDFEAKFNADKVKPGATVSVELHFKLKEGAGPYNLYHKDTVLGVPLIIDIKGRKSVELIGEWKYPTPKKYMEVWDKKIGEQPMLKMYKEVILVQDVKIPDDAKIGDMVSIWGTASGQFCDTRGCINFDQEDKTSMNRKFGWRASVLVAADGVDSKITEVSTESESDDDNPLWFLLVAFLAGMVTLLTPCVLPVLPLTIGFFVSQSAKGKSPFFTALIYCACIVGTFTFFGLLTSLLMGATGAQNISTNGYVNIFLGVLFAIFALSFLGMFELAMPRFLTSWFNKKQMGAAKEGNGYAKAFFSGSAFALISFSCTGPVAGAFLAGAAGGSILMPTMAMFVFSMGMALPIFILGQFPTLMKKMPKSGGWMNALKVVFGFVEIGLAVMYFSQAEQAFGSMAAAEWVNRFIVIAIWASCSFAIAAYLFGVFRMPHDHEETKQIGVVRAMFAVGFFAFAVYMIPGMFGAKYGQYLEGILPLTPESGGIQLGFGGGEGSRNDVHKLPWDKNFESGMIKAKAANKPVFLDFTGYN